MLRRRRALAALLIALPLVWGSSRIPVPGYTRLELTEPGSGRRLLLRLLPDGGSAVLTWTNSLFRLAVTERFVARGGILLLTAVTFADPAAGEPPLSRPEDLDDLYHTGGPFRVEGLARPVGRVLFRVGEVGRPRLRVGSEALEFYPAVGFGGRVLLETRRPTLVEWVRGMVSG
jgi:hypothetical protein